MPSTIRPIVFEKSPPSPEPTLSSNPPTFYPSPRDPCRLRRSLPYSDLHLGRLRP
jgi:hypothetical protein